MRRVSEILKKAREEKKLTLEDIHQKTKIRIKYLKAIEEGDWNSLPGTAYVRGFIKSYTDAVGLEPEKMMILFRREFIGSQEIEVLPKSIREENSKQSLFLTIKRIISKILSL